jgi:hypothetical protein
VFSLYGEVASQGCIYKRLQHTNKTGRPSFMMVLKWCIEDLTVSTLTRIILYKWVHIARVTIYVTWYSFVSCQDDTVHLFVDSTVYAVIIRDTSCTYSDTLNIYIELLCLQLQNCCPHNDHLYGTIAGRKIIFVQKSSTLYRRTRTQSTLRRL